MHQDSTTLIQSIAHLLHSKKGSSLLAIDVRGVSTLTDYIILANGNIERHVIALANEVIQFLENQGSTPSYIEGLSHGDWVVIDYLELIIYLFIPSFREKYRLEQLWKNGKIIDLHEIQNLSLIHI